MPDTTPPDHHLDDALKDIGHVEELYQSWFLDYASYVILDRAIPGIGDGLKPVQRRILHSLFELEDGRYNKAANIIGHTMRYHPHGDAAIADALVKLAQKDLLIDTQGNWGNVATGDRAAASRYIEARLTPFAKEVVFNPRTTEWLPSYDGRNKEPLALPIKFPLLLAQGAEGIAVGLSTRILPHNFCELIKAAIQHLEGKRFKIEPDFPSGGLADFSDYKEGKRGGKVKVRATIERVDSKLLRITELPFGTTTVGLIDSILAANDKGKIKIKRVEDNTAEFVDILVEVPAGGATQQMIEALYAFTDCEISISPNCCIILDDKPQFIGVNDLLRISTDHTKDLLRRELEIKRDELREKWHFASLEQIFIENKIYRKIESATTWEAVLSTIEKGLAPFAQDLVRPLVPDDIIRLTEIKIKRISKYDTQQAEEAMAKIKKTLREVERNLKNLVDYAIAYFESLLETYGKGKERRTKKAGFEAIQAAQVAMPNQKVYVNYKEGFIGTGGALRREEFLTECSNFDEIIGIGRGGEMRVSRVDSKVFLAKELIHVDVFKRGDDRRVYHMIYRDGLRGSVYAKRFTIGGITRDKEYHLSRGTSGSRVLYLSVNPNGEAEKVAVAFKPKGGRQPRGLVVDFSQIEIKGRTIKGLLVTKDSVSKVEQREVGASTLNAQEMWFDPKSGQLNSEEQGDYLGEFNGDEQLVVLYQDGTCELKPVSVGSYVGSSIDRLEVFEDQVYTLVYYEADRDSVYIKRFAAEDMEEGKRLSYLPQSSGTKVLLMTNNDSPLLKLTFKKVKNKLPAPELLRVEDFVDIKSVKALGKKLSRHEVKKVELLK